MSEYIIIPGTGGQYAINEDLVVAKKAIRRGPAQVEAGEATPDGKDDQVIFANHFRLEERTQRTEVVPNPS